eukprot:3202219-Rhodomonas_salina.3
MTSPSSHGRRLGKLPAARRRRRSSGDEAPVEELVVHEVVGGGAGGGVHRKTRVQERRGLPSRPRCSRQRRADD